MSCSECFVRFQKQQINCAIRHAYARLATGAQTVAKFEELLHYVRKRAARFLEAPARNGYHPGIEALVNLSRFAGAHIRPAGEWTGSTSSWWVVVASLAHHFLCKYEVPMFLASSWYSTSEVLAERARGWFIAHGRGASFRSLDLPIAMTRKMEHIFLASRDHLSIECAIRRAELLALNAPAEVVQAVLSTRLGADLSNGTFWRTVWLFLIANACEIDPSQIGPMIDFIHAIRHESQTVETPKGMVQLGPAQPAFSIKGRTAQSMLRLMRDWHRGLNLGGECIAWSPSSLQPMLAEEPSDDVSALPKFWQLLELTNSAQLRTEGTALHHCVASYALRCRNGFSRIWSLRYWRGEKARHVLTIEIDPRRRAVVQARGLANRVASGRSLRVLQDWAAREKLQLAI